MNCLPITLSWQTGFWNIFDFVLDFGLFISYLVTKDDFVNY